LNFCFVLDQWGRGDPPSIESASTLSDMVAQLFLCCVWSELLFLKYMYIKYLYFCPCHGNILLIKRQVIMPHIALTCHLCLWPPHPLPLPLPTFSSEASASVSLLLSSLVLLCYMSTLLVLRLIGLTLHKLMSCLFVFVCVLCPADCIGSPSISWHSSCPS